MTGRIFLLACAVLATAAAPPAPTPRALATRLDAAGAKAVVDDLSGKRQFDAVLDRIGRGSTDWVALAPRLAPGTDAASAEGLGIALAHALPVNAAAVLRAASDDDDGIIGLKRVCGVPFIETSRTYNAAYTRQALAALGSVHDPALIAKRARCRTTLTTP